jgi:hypothetical protein
MLNKLNILINKLNTSNMNSTSESENASNASNPSNASNNDNINININKKKTKEYLKKIKDTTIKYLVLYQNLSHIHPDWNNIECPHILDENLRIYMMTHCLHDKYQNIEHYRDTINNVFQRAIWHLVTIISSMNNDKIVYNENNYNELVNLLKGYMVLCRKREKLDFEEEYKFQTKRIMKDIIKKNKQTSVSEIVDSDIVIPDIINTPINLDNFKDTIYKDINLVIDPDSFFNDLCKVFKDRTEHTTINTFM